jgi:acid stress chaperone HdeB
MKRLSLLLVAAAVAAPVPGFAEKLDLSTITCERFLAYDKANIGLLLTWLEGYYSADNDDPVIDFDKMADNAKKLGAFCGQNPTLGVITAAEKIYLKDE